MRVGSLFAGIGGFDLGFERAGMRTAWQVERDPHCQRVLKRWFPGAERHDDVRHLVTRTLEPVDVICGGFPCQDLSVAGKRAGLAGDRSGLFYDMMRIVDELRPSWLVWENVPGLLSSNRGADFAAVLVALERIGYFGAWTTVNAQYFGVAQRRRRVFGVFARGDSRAAGERAAQVLALASRLSGNPASRQTEGGGTSVASLSGTGSGGPDDNDGQSGRITAASLRAADGHHGRSSPRGDGADNLIPFDTTQITSRANRSAPAPGDPCHPLPASGHPPSVAFTLNGSPRGTGPNSGNGWNSTLPVQVMPALQAGSPTYERGDGSLFCVPQVAWALEARDAKGVNSNTKDGHLLSGPLRSNPRNNSNGASEAKMHVYEPRIGVRRLTCRECERLQGFPDDWTDPIDTNPKRIASTHRYRMLGNAVEVHCAKWIGDRLAQEILL